MRIEKTSAGFQAELSKKDQELVGRLIRLLSPHVKVDPIGTYRRLGSDDLWLRLVGQIAVMGGATKMEQLRENTDSFDQFRQRLSLSVVMKKSSSADYLKSTLKEFRATRFPARCADRLEQCLRSPAVIKSERFALFDGLSHKNNSEFIRTQLLDRCPVFKHKSASDFMIGTGLSQDVIALDTRIIGVLKDNFDDCEDLRANTVQSKPQLYLAIESAIRKACEANRCTVGRFDRLLFQFSGMRLISTMALYPQLFAPA